MERFFEAHGAKTVFLARLVALLHPVTGALAGIWKTPWRSFLIYNLAGTLTYVVLYTVTGRYLGQAWELHKNNQGLILIYVVLVLTTYFLLGIYLRRTFRDFFSETASGNGGRIPSKLYSNQN